MKNFTSQKQNDIIKTTKAKSKIQGWYKREQRDENIEKGKDLVEKEIKRIGMSYEEIFKYVNAALEIYKFKNINKADTNPAVFSDLTKDTT